jgi:hypothetical protein
MSVTIAAVPDVVKTGNVGWLTESRLDDPPREPPGLPR